VFFCLCSPSHPSQAAGARLWVCPRSVVRYLFVLCEYHAYAMNSVFP
jgi:hypothetical protein